MDEVFILIWTRVGKRVQLMFLWNQTTHFEEIQNQDRLLLWKKMGEVFSKKWEQERENKSNLCPFETDSMKFKLR